LVFSSRPHGGVQVAFRRAGVYIVHDALLKEAAMKWHRKLAVNLFLAAMAMMTIGITIAQATPMRDP
jgi:hypothetical protein